MHPSLTIRVSTARDLCCRPAGYAGPVDVCPLGLDVETTTPSRPPPLHQAGPGRVRPAQRRLATELDVKAPTWRAPSRP